MPTAFDNGMRVVIRAYSSPGDFGSAPFVFASDQQWFASIQQLTV